MRWNDSPSSQNTNRMTIIAQSSPAISYGCPPPSLPFVVVVLLFVEEPFELLPGCVIVVLCVVDELVVDHGCHAKSAMRTATITISVMPIAAPLLPLSSCTITGSLIVDMFLLPRCRASTIFPVARKHKPHYSRNGQA